jgi:cation diffusion facilitator CzcD-associated flavoprotein CzcO
VNGVDPGSGAVEEHEVTVVGAGFGGLVAAHRLAGVGVDDVVILERGDGVGGTWRANTYPGAACDVPSHLYSLSFAPNPHWSRTYATQPEILAYVEDCYDRLDVRRKVRCGTEVVSATWDDGRATWEVVDRTGRRWRSRVLVSAVGLFHTPFVPDLAGLAEFGSTVFHSARWDHDHDLSTQRVAVIGTGASAIQVVPAIVGRTAHLDLYQRSPAWVVPRIDRAFTAEEQEEFASDPELLARHREEIYQFFEQSPAFVVGDPSAAMLGGLAASYLERKVPDPELRRRLTPDYPFGCKRVLISSDFYPAVQRDDVELVTSPIERITPDGVRTADGGERPCDTIVLCTGFRAAEYLCGLEVTGREGVTLHDYWAGRPRAFHGLVVPGFPNLFFLYGPNTNQGGNSILLMLEAQAGYVAGAMEALRDRHLASVEVSGPAMGRYLDELERALASTVWRGCATYFHSPQGEIVTQLPHTAGWYAEAVRHFDPADFEVTALHQAVPR